MSAARFASRLLAAVLLAGASPLAVSAADPPAAAPASAAPTGAAPLRAFFRYADIGAARLSPSGRWLAVTTGSAAGRRVLAVVDLEGQAPPTVAAGYADADVRSFDWVDDDRLVFNLVDLSDGSSQRFGPGLTSTRRDGSETRQLIARRYPTFLVRPSPGVQPLPYNHELLYVPTGGGHEVIVGRYQFDNIGELIAVHPMRLDVLTGRTVDLSGGAPDHAKDWLFDAAGEPRAAVTEYEGQREVWWRAPADRSWRSLGRFPARSAAAFHPAFVDASGALFVTARSSRGESVLKRFDFAAMRPEPEPIVSTPGFDFTGRLLTDSARTRVFGVRLETDAETTLWFDPAMQAIQKRVDAHLPGHINQLGCRRCNDTDVVLVLSYSDQDPGSYWIYRPQADAWQPVGEVRKGIDPRRSARVDFRRIQARDGQDLPVWVTALPVAKGSPPRPAMVLVHGGPWLRGNEWGWEAEAQFLASRGYVVIEPEFRGGTGFGAAHFESGWKQWGGTMQDDVADATRWAVGEGLADGRRICIAGASYGGYSTLMGLIRDPDLYRCGVAWVGVTDPRLLFESTWANDIDAEGRNFLLPQLIGDLQKDAAALARAAPVERAAEIRAPLLLAYGGLDRRVPIQHGRTLRAAMRAAGHDPEWVLYEDEGHGWLREENRLDFWSRVERFLALHLKKGD